MNIKVENLVYQYPDGTPALNGISFEVNSGERVALVGENGSGKTTLARHLNGLLHAQRGKVWVGDWLTGQKSAAVMAQRVAFVFQNPDEQLFCRSVRDEVAFAPKNFRFVTKEVDRFVEEALFMLGLNALADQNPRDLGLSFRKRVTIACAIAMQTPILIFDEPTAGLDAAEQDLLSEVFKRLHQAGKTLLIISHDMDYLSEQVDRFILLKEGQLLLDAPGRIFFNQKEMLETSGLLRPQLARLGENLGFDRPEPKMENFLTELSGRLKNQQT
ncbi:MAG: energy-coupling factor ABC transporter ATP-binding protein [Anaerolineae bacterium]|nr:energy-coupling factor ABC transporter ATP-binding protein [Anaerolineae bacterium]